jgi:hypothetical protein
MGAFKIFRKFSQLLDRETVDLPAINTPLQEALDAKAASADLADVATSGAYADLSGTPAVPTTVAELTDATIYDFPTLNTPVSDALAGKSSTSHTHTNEEVNTSIAASPSATRTAAGLGTISTFEGNQNLRTTDPATFAAITGTTGTFSGNVGIGTTSPSANLQVKSDSATLGGEIKITNNLSTATIGQSAAISFGREFDDRTVRLSSVSTGAYGVYPDFVVTANKNASGPSHTELLRVKNNGNLGIGTTTPAEKLDVVGNIKASGTVTQGGNVFSTFGNGWNINNSQGYYLRLTSDGVFSNAGRPLGTVSNPWGVVTCSDITASGTVKTGAYTVGTLPTPATGMRAYVTDSSVAANGHFGSAIIAAGGGTEYIVPVFYDGTDWIIA